MHTFTATGDNAAPQQASLRQHGHRIKAALGAIVFPVQRARWQAFVTKMPGLAARAQAHHSLLYKIYRPYASRKFGGAARVDPLCGHYRFLWQAGARPLVEYAARCALVLATRDGNYRLPYGPCRMADLGLVPSKKRTDARRRVAMLVQLAADMCWQVGALLHAQ